MSSRDSPFGTPNREQFARLVTKSIQQAGETRPIKYDSEGFCLTVEDEELWVFDLEQHYPKFCTQPETKREKWLTGIVNAWKVRLQGLPDAFDALHPRLLPIIRARAELECGRLQASVADNFPTPPTYHPIAGHLGLALIYEWPGSIQYITQNHLQKWGVTFAEAVEAARGNLAQRQQRFEASSVQGLHISRTDDSLGASGLLLLDAIRGLQVSGDVIAVVPEQSKLLVAGSEDSSALAAMAKMTEEGLNQPHPVSGIAMRLDGDSWVPWLPDPGHPQHRALAVLRLQTTERDYRRQTDLLKKVHKQTDQEVSVARLLLGQDESTGEAFSYCLWSPVVPALLPRTDRVAFMEEDDDLPMLVDWDRVCEVLGHLMEPQGMYPERYRVEDYPYGHELEKLGG
jgi:hypothetical protein